MGSQGPAIIPPPPHSPSSTFSQCVHHSVNSASMETGRRSDRCHFTALINTKPLHPFTNYSVYHTVLAQDNSLQSAIKRFLHGHIKKQSGRSEDSELLTDCCWPSAPSVQAVYYMRRVVKELKLCCPGGRFSEGSSTVRAIQGQPVFYFFELGE